MNRSEVRALVVEATRRTDKTTLMNLAINAAVHEVSSQRLWLDLMTEADLALSDNAGSVDLPSDCRRLSEVRLIVAGSTLMSRPLLIKPKTWVVTNYPDASQLTPSKPVYGYLENGKIFVVPYADEDYTLRITYFRTHPDLASDTDEVLIKHAGHVVVAYATYWTFLTIEKAEDAGVWYQTYLNLLNSAKNVDKDNSAIKFAAEQRGNPAPSNPEYWLDPFQKSTPGSSSWGGGL